MPAFDPTATVRQCVSCKRCYPVNQQFCRDCLVELTTIETIPYTINARYQLERIIKQGGSGFVFVATNLESGQDVVIKVIRASAMADPRAQDRFRREAQLAAHFHHAQIAAVYDFGMLQDASAYVVSEYVKGTTLRQEMQRNGKFKVDKAVPILAEICEALDAAHKAGLVHRDLKPESIILTPKPDQAYPDVKLVDFSFIKFASGKQFVPGTTAKLQAVGQLPLRPTYLSPEQYLGEEADLRSDIYSLGVIAYEMLGGQPPFTAKKVGEFGVKLLNSRPPSLRSLNPDVNIVIEAEILRALEKEPEARQQRALEFRRELMNAIHLS
ncbi:MAG: serine/threonine protein kinase [Acidobacteria bacterium]|nr:serine/threonine protein kinase [Acidobacteriota bacterium]